MSAGSMDRAAPFRRVRLHLSFAVAALLAAFAPTASAAPPPAQPKVTRIVAFGDSYADNGNLFRLLRIEAPAMYPKGRFSTGLNFVDAMGDMLTVPIINFAVGGAVTGAGEADYRPAGLDLQTRAFLTGGGPLGFPRTSGRLSPGDLVVISIGGNDARRYEKAFGLAPTQAQAKGAIAAAPRAAGKSSANSVRALDSLVRAGARNILFLGGDVGRLPEAAGTSVAPIGTSFSVSYNGRMREALAALSKRGVKARYVDLDLLVRQIEADPKAFGLTSAGACPRACLGDRALAGRYLFHFDKLHLTEAGYLILARHSISLLAQD